MRKEVGKVFDVHDYMSETTVDILLGECSVCVCVKRFEYFWRKKGLRLCGDIDRSMCWFTLFVWSELIHSFENGFKWNLCSQIAAVAFDRLIVVLNNIWNKANIYIEVCLVIYKKKKINYKL